MSPDQEEFDDLISRIRAGDTVAFEQLIQGYAPVVERAARVLLGRPLRVQFDTLDLLQTVHRSLLKGLRNGAIAVTDASHLRNFALTILRRKIAHRWRHLKRLIAMNSGGLNGNSAGGPEHPDPEPGPAAQASYADQVRLCLQSAEATDRHLLEMRLKGFTTADVARELGLDAGVLRVRLGRLRRRLLEARAT